MVFAMTRRGRICSLWRNAVSSAWTVAMVSFWLLVSGPASSAQELAPSTISTPAPEVLPHPTTVEPKASETAPATPLGDLSKGISPQEVQKMIDAALKREAEKRKKEEEQKKEDEDKKKKEQEEKQKQEADQWYEVGSLLGMTAEWKDGVWFHTKNDDFRYHIGFTVQYDLALYNASHRVMFDEGGPGGVGPINDGVNLRRGRLRAEGTMYEIFDFITEFEFFNGVEVTNAIIDQAKTRTFNSPGPTDFWIQAKEIPIIGHVKVGSQKEPFSLEHLNSYRYLEFMERSYLFDAFIPTAFNNGFTPGIMIWDTMLNRHGTWWLGFFKNSQDLFGFGVGDGQYAVDGRVTFLPIYENDGQQMFHIGFAASHRNPVDGFVQSRVREAVRNAPFPLLNIIANTGIVNSDAQSLINLEHAEVWGPVTVQAEYTASFIENASKAGVGNVGTFVTQGGYVEMLTFLTGEYRPWNRDTAIFDRVRPRTNFFWVPGQKGWCFGKGAWEIGARYTYLDLTDKGINGGILHDVTVGLNWYTSPNSKIQLNYDVVHRGSTGTNSDGNIQALGMRFAFDF